MKTTGIILAGGKSSRMGTNKALLDLNGRRVIAGIAERLGYISDELLIVTNHFADYEFLQLPMVADHYKGMGPLAGIEAGLSMSKTERNLIVACDMPFISIELGRYLLSCLENSEAALPQIAGKQHPLFAAYRREVLDKARISLEKKDLRIKSFLLNLDVTIITEKVLERIGLSNEEEYFFNMNRPEHYQTAIQFIKDKDNGN
nr:molybdenum cofactor guanylyltransferase [uncultured Bacillus sp.]